MHIGRRGLVVVLAISLNACGGLGTPTTAETPSSVTTGPLAPADAENPITATSSASGENASSTTQVVQATSTTNLVEPPVSTTTQGTSGQYDPALQSYVDQATADLADRLDTDSSSITVISAEAVVWPDGSLGCPEPGMVYTQALVDGLLIRLSFDGVEYRYHSGGRISTPFLCPNSK